VTASGGKAQALDLSFLHNLSLVILGLSLGGINTGVSAEQGEDADEILRSRNESEMGRCSGQ
jgi:hypothetical protein